MERGTSAGYDEVQKGVLGMKKLISFVMVMVMVFTLAGCKAWEGNDQFFDAEVLEINDNSILVKPIGGKDIPSAEQVIVSTKISGTNKLPDMEEGTEIRVMYGGDVMETEPARIEIVFAIYRLDEIKTN